MDTAVKNKFIILNRKVFKSANRMLTTEPIEFSILEKLHIGNGNGLRQFHKSMYGFRLFYFINARNGTVTYIQSITKYNGSYLSNRIEDNFPWVVK